MELNKLKKMIYKMLFLLNLLVMIFPLSYIAYYTAGFVRQMWIDNEMSDMYALISEPPVITHSQGSNHYIAPSSDMRTTEHVAPLHNSERFESLLSVNTDFLGMILIPELKIELPFVQGSDNSHYLNYDFKGKKSPYGTIFLDYRNNSNLSDNNNVIYGHNMKDGAMFHKLSGYADISTIQNAPVIYIDGLTAQSEWLVFAAYVCAADCGYTDICSSDESFDSLIKSISTRSIFTTNIDVNTDDSILTLSTCDYSFKNARFAVHARQKRFSEDISNIIVTLNQADVP